MAKRARAGELELKSIGGGMELKPGVWIASDSGGWWPMTARQRAAWREYKRDYEWQHEGMGSSVWYAGRNVEYSVCGYLFVVSDCGNVVWLRTSDGKMREVLAVEPPKVVWRREVSTGHIKK